MEFTYPNKKSKEEIEKSIPKYQLEKVNQSKSENIFIEGDNLIGLKVLRDDLKLTGKVDLVYVDPPFSTNNKFTITDGRATTISNSSEGDVAYSDKIKGKEFIEYIRERTILMYDLLSANGSFYLHIDYKIGHYVKVILDEIFGIKNFRNDITRIKCNPKNFTRKGYGNIKDLILFYSKSDKMIWNEPYEDYTENDIVRLFSKKDSDSRRYTTVPIHAPGQTKNGRSNDEFKGMLPPPGRHWRTDVRELEKLDAEGLIEWSSTGNPRMKIFADSQIGKRYQDIWEFKDPQYPTYPTEKNSKLLDLIIKTSSNEGSYVLDYFSGSGTTLISSHINNRKWIGIDKSPEAVKSTLKKFENVKSDMFREKPDFQYFKVL